MSARPATSTQFGSRRPTGLKDFVREFGLLRVRE